MAKNKVFREDVESTSFGYSFHALFYQFGSVIMFVVVLLGATIGTGSSELLIDGLILSFVFAIRSDLYQLDHERKLENL